MITTSKLRIVRAVSITVSVRFPFGIISICTIVAMSLSSSHAAALALDLILSPSNAIDTAYEANLCTK